MTKLVIVESPAKSKTIAKILGPEYVIRATYGHIIDLPTGKGSGLAVDIKNGFTPKYEVIPDKHDKIKAIVDAAKASDHIFLASDNDREGEMISWHVASQLDKLNKPMQRIVFTEITPNAIKKAIQNPRDIDEDLVNAQRARRVLDRIVGFMVSPYLSKVYGENLSAGRVQSVALKMIVERDKEIDDFQPETYFTFDVHLSKDKKQSFVAHPVKKITTDEEAETVKNDLLNCTYKVSDIVSDVKQIQPPAPLTTSKLQQDASAKFKLPVDQTMKAAQSLYEAGYVTYIRTDSTRLSPESLDSVREFLVNNQYKIPKNPNIAKNKDAAQDAHEAIRPTDVTLLPDKFIGEEDQKKVYELIWTVFVASQMTPVINDTVQVTIMTSNGYELKADGKIQRDPGWLRIAESFVKKTKDVVLPDLVKNDNLNLVAPKVKVEKKKTQPPSRFNEGTLVKDLEKKDIGRPSTYAAIISRLSNRKYVIKSSKGFQATELGKKVSNKLSEFFSFMDYKYTANMEKKLDDIASGNLNYIEMMTEFFDAFKQEFQIARGNEGTDTGLPCPKCGDKMVVRHSQYGFFAGCVKYPDCKGLVGIKIEDGKVIVQNDRPKVIDGITCPECKSGMVVRDGKFGRFYSCSNYPKCKGSRKIPFGKKCPKCNNELYVTLFNGESKLACMGYPDCKHVENLPEGSPINWVDPSQVQPPKFAHKVEKVLKT
jgi:DNA topoisomerase-1